MSFSRGRRVATAVIAAGTVITGVGDATLAAARPGDTTTAAPVITVTQTKGQLTVSPGTTVQAGRTTVDYTAAKGDHTLQAAVLANGYTPAEFGKDVSAGLEKGNLKAIHRLDTKVAWLGGTESKAGKTGSFTTVLPAGTVYLFDQESPARAKLTVTSPAGTGAAQQASAGAVVTKRLRWNLPTTLPAAGWLNLRNHSTEPHVFVAQRVKGSTTAKKVRAFIKTGAQQQPPWALKAAFNSGIFSPGTKTQVQLGLPAGKYLVLCYWPSKKNGMPHFMMGMWKLVHLR
ncbi:MAG TPA: hypothetical protein VHE56_13135 [Mycobacteriales bacterium]|nr:hypothetical protein [Mycobacteriales bacterium]